MDEEIKVEVTEDQPKKVSKKKKVEEPLNLFIGQRHFKVMEYKRCLFIIYGAFTKMNDEFDLLTSVYTKRAQESLKLPITGILDDSTYNSVLAMAGALE